ncbi:MAG: chlorophyll synthase ChlG [Alphaproteobacteria bacterium]|nr:chlorophyll synthase ChlG [Alphaproteobacteria bacterium]
MTRPATLNVGAARIQPSAVIEVLKPITWFPPMWAFACGAVSSGVPFAENVLLILAGVVLAGPLLCGASQVMNDWYDRHVDAINEPNRPIPSGRLPGNTGFYLAIFWTALSLVLAWLLGPWVFAGAAVGMVLSWAYSAPPLRLKRNGWFGNSAVAISYEGLAWFTGAAVLLGAFPDWKIILLAGLFSFGAHGIMTLNDFKALEGDRQLGVRSLPVQLGPARAAWVACVMMLLPQLVVLTLLVQWGTDLEAYLLAGVIAAQGFLMIRLMRDPKGLAPWYNATGVTLFVSGMMISAFAVRGLPGIAG